MKINWCKIFIFCLSTVFYCHYIWSICSDVVLILTYTKVKQFLIAGGMCGEPTGFTSMDRS